MRTIRDYERGNSGKEIGPIFMFIGAILVELLGIEVWEFQAFYYIRWHIYCAWRRKLVRGNTIHTRASKGYECPVLITRIIVSSLASVLCGNQGL